MSGDAQFTYADEDVHQGELEHWRKFTTDRGRNRRRLLSGSDRRLVIGASGGMIALLLVTLVVWQPWSSRLDPAAEALGEDSAAMLVQLRDAEGRAVVSAILLHDRTGPRGSIVGVPNDLAVDVPVIGLNPSASGNDVTTITEALVLVGESLTRDALSDLLGVEIDGSLVIDASRFATLVDRVGGVEIDSVRMDGDIALARATSPSDPPAVRAERFVQLLDALAAEFPEWELATDLLNATGVIGNATLPPERLAAIFVGAARDKAADALRTGVLPIRSNGLLDIEQATPIVLDLLGAQVRERSADTTPRIIVQFAVTASADGLGRLKVAARAAVVNAGYRFIDGGAVGPRAASSITTYGNTGIGDSLARALNLDPAVVSREDGRALADAIVVLGRDYVP